MGSKDSRILIMGVKNQGSYTIQDAIHLPKEKTWLPKTQSMGTQIDGISSLERPANPEMTEIGAPGYIGMEIKTAMKCTHEVGSQVLRFYAKKLKTNTYLSALLLGRDLELMDDVCNSGGYEPIGEYTIKLNGKILKKKRYCFYNKNTRVLLFCERLDFEDTTKNNVFQYLGMFYENMVDEELTLPESSCIKSEGFKKRLKKWYWAKITGDSLQKKKTDVFLREKRTKDKIEGEAFAQKLSEMFYANESGEYRNILIHKGKWNKSTKKYPPRAPLIQ